jgi:TRAP-type C4-dicarboxylate transport system substrate-binding protein
VLDEEERERDGEGTVRILCLVTVSCVIFMLAGAHRDRAAALEIKISHQWAEGVDGRDRATRVCAQEAEARAEGLKFRVYPNSSLQIKPTQLLAALQSNALAMAVYPLTYGVGEVPEFSLAGLPGLVPDLDAAHALRGSELHTQLQALAQANGIRILTWWWAPGGFFSKNRPIADPGSVRGLRMRGGDPLFEQMLTAAGAAVTNMPSTDIYAALQSDRLDAIATTYEAFVSLRLAEQTKFATVGSSLFMGFCPLVVSLKTWDALSPEQRTAIEKAAAISDAYFEASERGLERQVGMMLERAGVFVHRMTTDDYVSWVQLAQRTAWLEYTNLNPRARDLLLTTVRTYLVRLTDKDRVVDSIFGDDVKN